MKKNKSLSTLFFTTLLSLIFFLFVLFVPLKVSAQMIPLTNSEMSKISARGFDIHMDISMYAHILDGGSVMGTIAGIPIDIQVFKDTSPSSPTSSSVSSPMINISGQQCLHAFTNLNAVNSLINMGVNITVIMPHSFVGSISQGNAGVNFAQLMH